MGFLFLDQRIPLPKGVASGRDWGSTVVTVAKYQDGRTTFEDLARTALGGNTDHIKYLSWIKERFKKQITNEPASQGLDLAAYLYYVYVDVLSLTYPCFVTTFP